MQDARLPRLEQTLDSGPNWLWQGGAGQCTDQANPWFQMERNTLKLARQTETTQHFEQQGTTPRRCTHARNSHGFGVLVGLKLSLHKLALQATCTTLPYNTRKMHRLRSVPPRRT